MPCVRIGDTKGTTINVRYVSGPKWPTAGRTSNKPAQQKVSAVRGHIAKRCAQSQCTVCAAYAHPRHFLRSEVEGYCLTLGGADLGADSGHDCCRDFRVDGQCDQCRSPFGPTADLHAANIDASLAK